MKVPAFLWEEAKKIRGILHVHQNRIDFEVNDFIHTNLKCTIEYTEIEKIDYHRLFDLEISGIDLIMKDSRKNVFLLEDPQSIKAIIEKNRLLKTKN